MIDVAGAVGAAKELDESVGLIADQVLDLILVGRSDDARAHVRNAYAELKRLRVQLGEGMKRLYELRNEFLVMAGAV